MPPSSSADRIAEPEEVFDVPIRDRRRQFHLDPHQHTATSLDQQIDLVFSPVCPESFASELLLPISRKEPAGAPSSAGLGLANPFRAVQSDGGQLRQQLIQLLVNYPFRVFHRANATDSQVKTLQIRRSDATWRG